MSSLKAPWPLTPRAQWELACPFCQTTLYEERLQCETCGRTFCESSNIWRFLPPERANRYEVFLQQYQIVRADEGWGASHADYYRSLPWVDKDDPQWDIWRIRARSFSALLNRVVAPYEAQVDHPLNILDLGAGNCWLSYQLAERGHHVAAVDVSADARDGLGAYVWYEQPGSVLLVQAEFDHLPFAGDQINLVVFNASLHYSTDCAVTLAEAARVLRPDGSLVVMDSPLYHDGSSGALMVQERETAFMDRYGFRSDALSAENFLTTARLNELAAVTGIHWETFAPFNGVSWMLRPWRAWLRRRREPARLPLIIGTLMPNMSEKNHADTH